MAKYKIIVPWSTTICNQYGPTLPYTSNPICISPEDIQLVNDDIIDATLNTDNSVTLIYKGNSLIIPAFAVTKVDDSTPITFPSQSSSIPNQSNPSGTMVGTSQSTGISTNTKKWILIIVSIIIIIAILRSQASVLAKIIYLLIYALIGGYIYKNVLYPTAQGY